MNCAGLRDRIRELHPIADHLAIDENGHVLAQRGLIVEHIAARLRIGRKDIFENLAHCSAGCLRFRTSDVTLNIRGEYDPGHDETPLAADQECFRGDGVATSCMQRQENDRPVGGRLVVCEDRPVR
jgi:hypothetical protein